MRSRQWWRGPVSGLLSGLLLALSFPLAGWFPLAWLALVPLLAVLLEKPSRSSTLAAHLGLCLVYFGVVLYWIPRVLEVYGHLDTLLSLGVFAVLLLGLLLCPIPFTLLTRWLANERPRMALLAAPAAWLLGELLRAYFFVDGFPWGSLGYSQYPYRCIVQVTDLVGVYGLSWLVALGSSAAVAWWKLRWRAPAVLFGALFLASNSYGLYRLYFWTPQGGEPLRVALVQPDLAVSGDHRYYAEAYFRRLPEAYSWAAAQGVDLVIFPEAPNPFYFLEDFYFNSFYQRLLEDYRTPLIFNGTARRGEQSLNSAFLLDDRGRLQSRYDKLHLVPFGEYLPYGQVLGFARPLVGQIGGFSAGDPQGELVQLDGIPLGMLICYEAIFPELSRQAVGQGAQLLVNLTNDLWFGDTAAPVQHIEMAAFRAVEQRKFLLRAANSGFSALVDPWGRIQSRTRLLQQTIVLVEVRPNRLRTWYSRWGEWPCFLIIMSTFLALLWSGSNASRIWKRRRWWKISTNVSKT